MSKMKYLITCALMAVCLGLSAAERINVNQADAATLAAEITGIGPARAEAIVAYREAHGPFQSVDDLLLVQGIGEATLNKNRERLTASTR